MNPFRRRAPATAMPHPTRGEARHHLRIAAATRLVVGWAGPLDRRSGLLHLLEAATLCAAGIVLVIPADGPAHQELVDRADALEIEDRIRFAPAQGHHAPHLLAASDALLLAPSRRHRRRAAFLAAHALAQAHALPTIGVGDAAFGPQATWSLRADDPGLLARLLDGLAANPALLAQVPPSARHAAAGTLRLESRPAPSRALAGGPAAWATDYARTFERP